MLADTRGERSARLVAGSTTPDVHFTDLGGDSLSALTFANLLREFFDVDVPVGVTVIPATDLQAVAAYIQAERRPGAKGPACPSVHGRDATEVHAGDLITGQVHRRVDPRERAVAAGCEQRKSPRCC